MTVPTYGDPDAWLDSISGTPPRKEEWRFMPTGSYGPTVPTDSPATSVARPPLRTSTSAMSNSLISAPAATKAPGGQSLSGRSSPLGLSLEGTGLWNASTGSGKGSVFRPDTPSPMNGLGRKPSGNAGAGGGGAPVSVPLTSRWLYERGREEGRF